jgi:uncharacterized protein (DUF4213/DUF364 family)
MGEQTTSGGRLVAEWLLAVAAPAHVRIMPSPTAPLWPRPFFGRGIDILGASVSGTAGRHSRSLAKADLATSSKRQLKSVAS